MGIEVQNFQEDVIEASSKIPVLVDFWAEWCGPCRVLGPILDKLEAEQSGSWKLAKVDTDQNPELSTQYGIQGIPAVKLFVDGNVVSEFTGALPELEVRKWLEAAIPTEANTMLAQAEESVSKGQNQQAIEILESILKKNSDDLSAAGLLARLLVFQDPDRAVVLAQVASDDPRFMVIGEAISLVVEFRTKHQNSTISGVEEGRDEYLNASKALDEGDLDAVLVSIIEVLKKNRYIDDDGARKTGVALFTLLGDTHPLTQKYRRTFNMWLY
ncbi:MAG: thioredoxin [Bacteroidetes bacterium]|nr:MAG: thioredoxin [Bacteroidota bacterium]